jgi:Coenzyme PQQ synthesis protein D (PqqD)
MLVISSTIRRTRTPDGGILLDIERGRMFCLNPVGSKILDLLDEGCDQQQIVDQVSAAFGAEVEVARADVRAFLEALSQHDIVRESGLTSVLGREANHGTTDAA